MRVREPGAPGELGAATASAGTGGPSSDGPGADDGAGASGARSGTAGGDVVARREREHEAQAKPKPKPKGPSKNRLRSQAQAERAVEAAEAAMRALEEELADPAAWATQYEAAKSEARHTAARRAVEEAYARLEALSTDT